GFRRRLGARHVVERRLRVEHGLGDRAIDQPGIEMAQPVVSGEALRHRALARRRRSVDGDDHAISAPRVRIIATNPGKLVAMNAVSSTLTGLSAARPMTSADMAMR